MHRKRNSVCCYQNDGNDGEFVPGAIRSDDSAEEENDEKIEEN